LKLEGFQYATLLDLNMGYYYIELSPYAKQLCTIVLPWGKYKYQCLPMGLCNSPDIFQEKMICLMADLEYVREYIYDLLIITKGTYLAHLQKLATALTWLQQAGLKVNANKSWFAQEELEYLGYWITRNRIQPAQEKVAAIQNISAPTKKRRNYVALSEW
jgi:Reverse transcriptase (RNA-dependent DNA polymerase)